MDESEALTAHLQECRRRMAAVAWRVLRNADEADDALQDALVRIWKERRRVLGHPNPPALMVRMTFQTSIDHWRRRRKQPRPATGPEMHPPLTEFPGAHGDPQAALAADETREQVLAAIARLPGKQAAAMYLRAVEEMSYAEVASAIGCDESTARVHMRRGRERLRRELSHLIDGANST